MVVLLPGMDGTGELFEPLLKCMPAECEAMVIRYPRDVRMSYEQLEEFVRERLPQGKAFTVIAESFSGPIGLRLAARVPEGLRAVVLVCSFGYRPLGLWGAVLARLPLRLLMRWPMPGVVLRALLLGWEASDELVWKTRETIAMVSVDVVAGRLREALASEFLKTCDSAGHVRVIGLYSEKDRLLGRRAQRSIVESCRRAEMIEIGTAHLALQTEAPEVLRVLGKLGV